MLSAEISFGASAVQTKGLIGSQTGETPLDNAQTRIRVFDFMTGGDPEVEVKYIDDVILGQTTSGPWAYESGAEYHWTKTGAHKFFGFLTVSPDGTAMPSWSWDDSNKKLSIPATAMTKDTPQFDFLYSDVVTRDSETGSHAKIDLSLKHFFSALSISLTNTSPDEIYIASMSLSGLHNQKSATLSYNTDAVTVSYASASATEFFPTWPTGTASNPYGRIIPAGNQTMQRYDLIGGAQLDNEDAVQYYLMWPQDGTEFAAVTLAVTYYIKGVYDPEDSESLEMKTRTFNLRDALEWSSLEAGSKYRLELEFKDKTINLTLTPLPWTMDYADMDYSTSTILANSNKENDGVLWLYYKDFYDPANPDTYRWIAGDRGREITMQNKNDIQGRFYILAPMSGQWRITTYGDGDASSYFDIVPSSGAIEDLVDGEGNFQGRVEFLVKAREGMVLDATKVLHFNVDIMLNGQWRNGNTEFNRKDWRLTREP